MELKLIERGDLKFTQIKVGVKEYENVCKPVGEAQRRIQMYDSSLKTVVGTTRGRNT